MSYALTVSFTGTGSGTITVTPGTLSCTGNPCTANFASGTLVTLTPVASPTSTFVGWTGACTGQGACNVTMSQARTASANFSIVTHTLTFAKPGQGTGTVSSSPAGLSCGAGCFNATASFTQGTAVTLTATPAANSVFGGWTGCAGADGGTCALTMNAPATVQATFDLAQRRLTTTVTGAPGTILSSPAGISCNPTCTSTYDHGFTLFLSAVPAPGSHFVQWTGACAGSPAGSCMVTLTADTTVSAEFALDQFLLTVNRTGAGTGTVTSVPGGITCGAACTANFDYQTLVNLTATAAPGSTFAGWTSYCTSTNPVCPVTVDQARNVTASFSLNSYNLQLTNTGNGTVTPSPLGTSCGVDCYRYTHGTSVTLTPAGGTGSSFGSWSGDCTGTGTCSLMMTGPKAVTATFPLNLYTITVARTGGGLVTSTPAGVSCGATCSFQFAHGTSLSFFKTPDDPGVDFNGWTGPCTGTGACTFTVTGPVTVNASFTRNRYPLTISKPNDGYGLVSSVPVGVSCGSGCVGYFPVNASVTLSATPAGVPEAQESTFIGWGAPCSGTGPCVVTMDGPKTVPANFKLRPNYAFVTSTKHDANFGGLAGADTYCQQTANAAFLPGTFKAYLGTQSISSNSRLGTASGWVLPSGRPLANTVAQLGTTMWAPLRMTEGAVDVTPTSDEWAFITSFGECGDFTNTTGSVYATTSAGLGGMLYTPSAVLPCASQQRLFCFGVDRSASVSLPAPLPTVRYAFVTPNQWLPGGGLTAADAFCQAAAGTLPGTYKALLATTTASAGSRFSIVGAPWVRVDGVPLTSSASALFTTPYFDVTPNLDPAGVDHGAFGIWTGIPAGGNLNTTVGTVQSTCGDWTNSMGTADLGRVGWSRTSQFTSSGGRQACTQLSTYLVCLQE